MMVRLRGTFVTFRSRRAAAAASPRSAATPWGGSPITRSRGGYDGSFERTSIAYDLANRETSETSISIRSDGTYQTNLTNTYSGGQLASQAQQNLKGGVDSAAPDTNQSYSYAWWDGAIQSAISYDGDTASSSNPIWTTTYAFDSGGHIATATIADGQPRTATFVTDQNGMVVDRTETKNSGNTTSAGSPRGLHYMFAGQQLGTASNNGSDNTSYTASIATRLTVPPASPGPFANGAASATPSYDFDQNYDAINGSSVASTSGSYTAQGGETLASIAQTVWGDASLWYLLADANGLGGSVELTAGQTVTIPNKVVNRHNSSDTFRPYDPNEALGDTSPTNAAKPPKAKSNKCGSFGVILLLVVAVAVTAIVTAGVGALATGASFSSSLSALAGGTLGTLGATATTAGLGTLGAIGAGVAGAVVGSVVSQGLGLLTGIQDKFSWKSAALAGLTAAVSGGIGAIGQGGKGAAAALEGAAKSATGSVAATTVNSTLGAIGAGAAQAAGKAGLIGHALTSALRSAAINATTQGIATATGLQDKFDWGAVASSAVGGGLASSGIHLPGGQVVNSVAARIAGVGAQGLVSGTDFGDNLMHALPDIIGQTIGDLVTGVIRRAAAEKTGAHGPSTGVHVHPDESAGGSDTGYRGFNGWGNGSILGPAYVGNGLASAGWSADNGFGLSGISAADPFSGSGQTILNAASTSALTTNGYDVQTLGLWTRLGFGYVKMDGQQNGQDVFLNFSGRADRSDWIDIRTRSYEGGGHNNIITVGGKDHPYWGGNADIDDYQVTMSVGSPAYPNGYADRINAWLKQQYIENNPTLFQVAPPEKPSGFSRFLSFLGDIPLGFAGPTFHDLQRGTEALKTAVTAGVDYADRKYQQFRDWDDRQGNLVTNLLPGGRYGMDFAEGVTRTVVKGLAATPDALLHLDRTVVGTIRGVAMTADSILAANNQPALTFLKNSYDKLSSMSGRQIAGSLGDAAGTVLLAVGPAKFAPELAFVGGEGNLGATMAAREFAAQDVAIHGNSALSPRTAYLYELYSKDGTFLKNGVTQNLDTRYSTTFMKDKDIIRIDSGSRADMLALERQRTITNPGPLNLEPWAVKARAARGSGQ